jgi:hypothetical protein
VRTGTVPPPLWDIVRSGCDLRTKSGRKEACWSFRSGCLRSAELTPKEKPLYIRSIFQEEMCRLERSDVSVFRKPFLVTGDW